MAFTKTVAAEVARRSVTVNAVALGLVDTRDERGDRRGIARTRAGAACRDAEEVAACVRFLASQDAAYVTGIMLTVDGGLTAKR